MTATATLIVSACSGCDDFPCRCPRPVTVRCVCGTHLTASDTLEDKRRAHVEHVRSVMHEAWRAHAQMRRTDA